MKKRILLVLIMGLLAGASFAQIPKDSTQTVDSTFVPHLKYKVDRDRFSYKYAPLKKKKADLPKRSQGSLQKRQESDVTPFYSNMPMAKVSKKRLPIPSAKADSATHYHLLKKRYKVIPIPKEEQLPAKD